MLSKLRGTPVWVGGVVAAMVVAAVVAALLLTPRDGNDMASALPVIEIGYAQSSSESAGGDRDEDGQSAGSTADTSLSTSADDTTTAGSDAGGTTTQGTTTGPGVDATQGSQPGSATGTSPATGSGSTAHAETSTAPTTAGAVIAPPGSGGETTSETTVGDGHGPATVITGEIRVQRRGQAEPPQSGSPSSTTPTTGTGR